MEELIFQFVNYYLEKNVILVYVLFMCSAFLQSIFPPHPGDVLLVFQGYLTVISKSFNLIPILIISLVGTFLSSLVVFRFGFTQGDKVFENRLVKRFVDESQKEKAKRIFDKYGSYAILIGKFVPGVSMVMIIFAGIFKLRARATYTSIIISIIIHDLICVYLGRFLGNNMEHVKRIFSTYNSIVIALVLVSFGGYGVYQLIVRKKKLKKI